MDYNTIWFRITAVNAFVKFISFCWNCVREMLIHVYCHFLCVVCIVVKQISCWVSLRVTTVSHCWGSLPNQDVLCWFFFWGGGASHFAERRTQSSCGHISAAGYQIKSTTELCIQWVNWKKVMFCFSRFTYQLWNEGWNPLIQTSASAIQPHLKSFL